AALPRDLVAGAGAYDCGRLGVDELCAALDRATSGPLQRAGAARAWGSAPQQRHTTFRAHPRAVGAAQGSSARSASGRWLVDKRQGRHLDGGPTRAREGCPAAWLGSAPGDRLVDPVAAAAASQFGDARTGSGF